MRRKLIYFCPETKGGLVDYAREQAEAITRQGVEVIFLTKPGFQSQGVSFRVIECLKELPENLSKVRWIRRYQHLQNLIKNMAILRGMILSLHVKEVLWSSFFEYGSPFWVGCFEDLLEHEVRMGVMVHDPVRDYRIGPEWWHEKSIVSAQKIFHRFFYHEPLPERDCRWNVLSNLDIKSKVIAVPHGMYHFSSASKTRQEMRRALDIPEESWVWLSFGYLRDNKNLELAISSLQSNANAVLLVVGKEQSSEQKPLRHYQEWARLCGVESRCRWVNDFIPESEVGNYFEASDAVLLTYSKSFRSSSGVLSHAVRYRRPVLASGGESGLTYEVQKYDLGLVVESDSGDALSQGMQRFPRELKKSGWDEYEKDHAWDLNARLVLETMN